MKKYIITFWILLFAAIYGCRDAEIQPKNYPYLVTKDVTDINTSGVTFSAEIIPSTNDDTIVDYGFIWGENDEFKFSFASSANMANHFSVRITSDLIENKNYSCRAYLITKRHTIYGNKVSFKALGCESPKIYDFYPKSGFDTEIITLKGKSFSYNVKNNIVKINNMQAEVLSSTDDSLTFRIPLSNFVGEVAITLTVGNNTTTTDSKLTILEHEIESVSSNSGYSGNYITITGKHFLRSGSLTVNFGSYRAEIQSFSDNQIIAMVPVPIYFQLMNDTQTPITVTSGVKTKTHNNIFTIKKSWTSKTPTPFTWHYEYQAVEYNGKGYILELNEKMIYEYNPNNDQWNEISSSLFPGERFDNSIFIVSNEKLYKIGGISWDPISDVWSYDFVENNWIKKKDIPFTFLRATFFRQDDSWYIITNYGQVWKCDLENEVYIKLNDFPKVFTYSAASAFMADGKNYVATYGQTWLYDKLDDNWIEKSSNPFSQGYATRAIIGFSYKNTGYILDRGQFLFRYDYENDYWYQVSIYPGIRGDDSYKTTFVNENGAYIVVTFGHVGGIFANSPFMFLYND